MTGEDLGYRPSVFEQAKFGYSPLGNIFTKGLDKDHQKEGFLKGYKILKIKSKSCWTHLVSLIKLLKLLKIKVIIIMTVYLLFTGFTETLKILKECH